jgi:exosortase H (IPTLxxWG-CTERM-specific)
MKRGQKIFFAKFFVAVVGLYLLMAWNPVNDHVVVPFTRAIAGVSGALLRAMGQDVGVAGTSIVSPRVTVNINNGCNGLEAMLLVVAAIGSFPASLRARLVGLALDTVIVQVLNAVRIVSLYLVGAYQPSLFSVFHTAVWQVAVMLAAIVFFLQWSARVVPSGLANPR